MNLRIFGIKYDEIKREKERVFQTSEDWKKHFICWTLFSTSICMSRKCTRKMKRLIINLHVNVYKKTSYSTWRSSLDRSGGLYEKFIYCTAIWWKLSEKKQTNNQGQIMYLKQWRQRIFSQSNSEATYHDSRKITVMSQAKESWQLRREKMLVKSILPPWHVQ